MAIMKRPIRTALIPLEACNRMYNALKKLYSAILDVRNERNRAKRIEKFYVVFEADGLIDDAYAVSRYSKLKNLFLHLQNSFNLAKKDPHYLVEAISSAVKAKILFEKSRKSEHESMKKCNFLRKESAHLKRSTQRMENQLRSLLKQKLKIAQEKKQKGGEELKKQFTILEGGKGKNIQFPRKQKPYYRKKAA